MTVLLIILALLAILFVLYVLALRCRRGHKQLAALRGWSYAHRGLYGDGTPENSMQAFRLALEGGYGIELDVHLMADGNLAVIHDSSLKRIAGAEVNIEDLTLKDLQIYSLNGTQERIPLFEDVLNLYQGKAPIIVEIKTKDGNYAALTEAVCKLMESYSGDYCLESFDPRVVYWLRKNRPELCRGQLSENYFNNTKSKQPWLLKFALTHLLENFLVVPDFVAYRFGDRKTLGVWLVRKLWRAQGVTWTVTSKADYDIAVAEGWIPIFEGFRP